MHSHFLTQLPSVVTRLEHVGIAVDKVEAAVSCLEEVLNQHPYKAETVSSQQVRTHFLNVESAKLELLESLDADSAVGRFLNKRGEGIHHLAFEVEDVQKTMDRLHSAGFTLLSETPQVGADGKRIVFVHPKETHGVLIEFCETQAPDWSPRTLSHRAGRLAVYERGNGSAPSVLLLHGAGGSTTQDLAPVMRELEPSFHVIGIDFSGHGSSSFPPSDDLRFEHFVGDVERVLRDLDVPEVHLFGFSMGSAVAARAAVAFPDHIRRLGLFAPIPRWTSSLVEDMKTRLDLRTLQKKAPARTAQIKAEHDEPERLFDALRSLIETFPSRNAEMKELLASVTVPTLVMGLDADPLARLKSSQTAYQEIPNARLCILPGTRHEVTSQADLLSTVLRRHFSED